MTTAMTTTTAATTNSATTTSTTATITTITFAPLPYRRSSQQSSLHEHHQHLAGLPTAPPLRRRNKITATNKIQKIISTVAQKPHQIRSLTNQLSPMQALQLQYRQQPNPAPHHHHHDLQHRQNSFDGYTFINSRRATLSLCTKIVGNRIHCQRVLGPSSPINHCRKVLCSKIGAPCLLEGIGKK
ncbi:Hypothetical predicted protein [Olea europaea subsp. europaea]|uniref:Uncharacterized protein n=1 Tax=Olea europaea subsp. europaea TaxID=158383 RepID=A0A8S0SKS3_OLEEU|nr:Hypothetical predicted protein [Olea europaea subsp. europaea]